MNAVIETRVVQPFGIRFHNQIYWHPTHTSELFRKQGRAFNRPWVAVRKSKEGVEVSEYFFERGQCCYKEWKEWSSRTPVDEYIQCLQKAGMI